MVFVVNYKRVVEVFGIGVCLFYVIYIRRCKNGIVEVLLLKIGDINGFIFEVVYWNIKKVLNLICVEVYCYDMIGVCGVEEVGNEFGRNRYMGFVFLVLMGIFKVRDDSCDVIGRSLFGCINYE